MCFRKQLSFLLTIIFPLIECIPVLISKYQDSHYINDDAAYSFYFLATVVVFCVVICTCCGKRQSKNQKPSSSAEHSSQQEMGQRKNQKPSSSAEHGSQYEMAEFGSEGSQGRKQKAEETSFSQGPVKTSRPSSLSGYGYMFDNGRLCDILQKSQGFKFDHYKNKEADQRRYEEIGALVEEYVYSELENECEMVRLPIPIGGSTDWPDSTFIFASRDYKEQDKLMVLIHGNGAVRAGQWSRKLIINDSMESGSQIPYIQKAMKQGFAVLVLNTNDNYRNGKRIRGSESAEEHARYVWENYIRKAKAGHIAIVAHSYGGRVTTSLLNSFTKEFRQKVFAVAFTDASLGDYPNDIKKRFEQIGRNWVKSDKPLGAHVSKSGFPKVSAGTNIHELTSYMAINDVFKFIMGKLEGGEQKASRSSIV